MTRTYAGPFKNPTEGFRCSEQPDGDGKWFVEVEERCECGSECCSRPVLRYRPHTNGQKFDEPEDVIDWIESLEEHFEEDYDQYLEESPDGAI
jgi:hypothetical protein